MSNSIRTFRAASVAEAMAQVRREMGVEAVVVETKQVTSRGLFAWLSARQEVEIKASPSPSMRRAAVKPVAATTTSLAPTAAKIATVGTVAAAAAAQRSSPAENKASTTNKPVQESRSAVRPEAANTLVASPAISDVMPQNRIAVRDRENRVTTTGSPRITPVPFAAVTQSVTSQSATSAIEHRLDSLQQMIAELGKRTRTNGLVDIPAELFPHYLTLVESDVDEDVARELILKLQRHAAPGQLDNTASTTALLAALIEREILCTEPLLPKPGHRQIAMVVGPTGVGKTTTLAKLAGRFGVQQGLKLGLITVDTYRVAAVEQLRTYAEIIDLPMRVVSSVPTMHEALDAFADRDLVLIDTAGRSPHDERRLCELNELIDAACPDHVYLVLSLASGAKSLRAAADRFNVARPTSLIVTKLDEADGCGGLLTAPRDIGLPISYFTTGQEVPRDIEPANPCRAAQLILGLDKLTRHPQSEPSCSLGNRTEK